METTIDRPLPIGINIDGTVHKDFEIRAPLVEDVLEAEKAADARQVHAFNIALLSQVVVRIGSFKGAVTPNMLKRMKRADYNAMITAMLEIEDQGEDQSGVAETSTVTS